LRSLLYLIALIGLVLMGYKAWVVNSVDIPVLVSLPEFNHCTCDSATYCLDDSDVMKIHMWYDSIQYSLREK